MRHIYTSIICGIALFSLSAVCFADKYAFVIGIDNYDNFKSLHAAVADAQDIAEVLSSEKYGFKVTATETIRKRGVQTGSTQQSSFGFVEANVITILDTLADFKSKLDGSDEFILYFAGHGLKAKSKTFWLTPKAATDKMHRAIDIDDVMNYVRDIPTLKKLLILDHCYSGDVAKLMGSSTRSVEAGSPRLAGGDGIPEFRGGGATKSNEESGKGRAPILLAAAKELAYESQTRKHGMFTEQLLKILRQQIPASELLDTSNGNVGLSIYSLGYHIINSWTGKQSPLFYSGPLTKENQVSREWMIVTPYRGPPQVNDALEIANPSEALQQGDYSKDLYDRENFIYLNNKLGNRDVMNLYGIINGKETGHQVFQGHVERLFKLRNAIKTGTGGLSDAEQAENIIMVLKNVLRRSSA